MLGTLLEDDCSKTIARMTKLVRFINCTIFRLMSMTLQRLMGIRNKEIVVFILRLTFITLKRLTEYNLNPLELVDVVP